ncbi:MAG: transcription initiation factor IIB, partial [Hadesarchaea archaeon]|nr:transcription initiation factor IIB [Hadesarchaea archaeon]
MRCPSCGNPAVLFNGLSGELICTRCGLVILEKLPDLGPEWRPKPDENVARADVMAGVDVTRHDLGIGSEFDLSGELSPSWRARIRRLRMWQNRCRASNYGEKSLREA